MNRSFRVLTALSACAFLLASCSSGASKTKTTLTIGNSVPRSDPATTPAPPITPTACSLVPSATVKAVLGSLATGKEADPQASVYKACEWDTKGSAANKLSVGLIRIGNGQAGFGSTFVGFSAQTLQGVGDSAVFSSGKNSAGEEERLLVSKKGTVSISISSVYGGTKAPPDSIQDDFTSLAKEIFSKLGA